MPSFPSEEDEKPLRGADWGRVSQEGSNTDFSASQKRTDRCCGSGRKRSVANAAEVAGTKSKITRLAAHKH